MADLTEIQASQSVKIAGAGPSSGIEDNYADVDSNGNLLVKDYSDGPVTPGTVASGSSLIGGQFNTILPTLTTGQQSAIQIDSSGRLIIAPTTQGALAEDHNYGTVGATTLRTASQIGNATGAADFNAGATGAQTLRVVANQGAANATPWNENVAQFGGSAVVTGVGAAGAGIPRVTVSNDSNILATQSGTWTVQPGNTANTTAWFVKDNSLGTVAAGAAGTQSSLAGGVFNTALPTLTNGQQAALQLDSSGRLIISSVASGLLSEDHNYGTVGASTLRTASQIGNATGAALFGAGTTTAQVLRVVLPTDQTAIPASQSGTWTVQPGNTANTTPWLVTDTSDGPVAAGTAATKSSLAGGVFNTALPTLTNTQQSAIQLDSSGRLIVSPTTQGVLAEDHNYGAVGASTLRTASQIGNATGSADFAAGNSSAQTLRVVIATNQAVLTIQGDSASGAAKAGNPVQIGGVFNTTQPTVTTGQTVEAQSTARGALIVATGVDTFTVKDSNFPTTVDTNYGAVGASTLRTASQIGNATGGADFNYGAVGAQTLRVASQIGNATGAANFGAGATGAQTLRVEANQGAAGSTAWLTTDAADGPVAAGTAATKSMLMGGQFNTTLPTLTTGQQAALQTDSSGRLLVSGISQDVAPATINITARDIASTTTVVANGQNFITGAATANSTAAFAFTSECTVVVQVSGAWTGTLQIEISLDGGTTWSPTSVNQDGTDYTVNAFTGNFTGRANVAAYTNFRVRATAAWTGTATVKVIESVNQASVYIANAIRLTDQGGSAADISANNDLQVVDTVDTAGQNRAQSVTTTAAEALGAASILTNRKSLTVTPTNGTVYWGYSNAVTTANGTPIFKNQSNSWAIGSLLHVWLICASGTVDCRITEAS